MRTQLDHLMGDLYGDLRAIARSHLNREHQDHTLGATALVNEAYLRLAPQNGLPTERTLFLGAVSTTMRRVLVDHARRRKRVKRGAGVTPVPLDDRLVALSHEQADELLALDEALDRLAAVNPRATEVVMLRFFGGLTLCETATHLGLSRKTVQRDGTAALALLRTWISADLPSHVEPTRSQLGCSA